MAFNPTYDYKEVSASDRPERPSSCRTCRKPITLIPPVQGPCWACWAGHPAVTKPTVDLTQHPHYIATMARLQERIQRKAIVIAGSAQI